MPTEPTQFTTCLNELSQFQVRGQVFQRLQNAECSVPILRVQTAPLEGPIGTMQMGPGHSPAGGYETRRLRTSRGPPRLPGKSPQRLGL